LELTASKNSPYGIVYLVGAGPGDPGLLTIKGQKCLERAEVVIYDRLISEVLLGYASQETIFIDVGKSPGQQPYSQEDINKLLIKYAVLGRRVVRLKGGDPFLFGRGGEEALALKEAGIPFEVVPGVTSAIAAPAYAGIPVTQRGMATSVTILTGHEMAGKGQSQINWEAISQASQTLLILMGTANLGDIVGKLIAVGLAGTTPVAIIENGTTTLQRVLRGNLQDILQIATETALKSPAVIIIGEVVNLADALDWVSQQKPLLGKRIMLTRPLQQIAELAGLISEVGAEAVICPTIKLVEGFKATAENISQAINNADWLVFTSVNGVVGFFKLLQAVHLDLRLLYRVKVAVIGAATHKALAGKGILADLMPKLFTAEDLAKELAPLVNGAHVLLLRVNDAPRDLADILSRQGAIVEEFPVYAIQSETQFAAKISEHLTLQTVQAVTFTSPSTVKGFLANINGELRLLDKVKVVCIGPVTAKFAREQNIHVDKIAENSSNEEMVKALISVLGEKRKA
jgi:uroporphyrinogen III methyltransferase / synthase